MLDALATCRGRMAHSSSAEAHISVMNANLPLVLPDEFGLVLEFSVDGVVCVVLEGPLVGWSVDEVPHGVWTFFLNGLQVEGQVRVLAGGIDLKKDGAAGVECFLVVPLDGDIGSDDVPARLQVDGSAGRVGRPIQCKAGGVPRFQ